MREFYACYLLQSQGSRSRGKTYIGFTVNPKRRIRQHNGEIGAGAWKTKSGRPWCMVLAVYGFPTKVQALQFEWAWQHPEKSKAVRDDVTALVASCKRAGLSGAKGKIRLLMLLLNSQQWRYFPLTVQVLSTDFSKLLHGVASPPDHVSVLYGPAETLPTVVADDFDEGELKDCDSESEAPAAATCEADISISAPDPDGHSLAVSAAGGQSLREEAEKPAELDPKLGREAAKLAVSCAVCEEPAKASWLECPSCTARAHLTCLAAHFIQSDPLQPSVPARGPCPMCGDERTWAEALLSEKHVGWAGRRSGRARPILKADPKLKQITASRKPRSSSSSSSIAPEVDEESQGQAPETSAKPAKSSGGGRRRAASKKRVVAPKDGSSQAAAAPDQADLNQGSRLVRDEASAQAGDNPEVARSTAAKAKKLPRRRKALIKVAPCTVDSDAGLQTGKVRPSAAGRSSAPRSSKAAGCSSRVPQHDKALAGEPFVSSLCNDNEPSTIEQSSQCSAVRHASSPATEVAGGTTAAQAGESWALPAQDAWCYIASSPELSMQASPQLAACQSSLGGLNPSAQRIEKLDSSRKGVQTQPSGLAKSSRAGSSLQKPISLLSSDSEEEREGRQGTGAGPAAVARQEKLGKRCRSTRKVAGARGAAPKSPRACPGRPPATAPCPAGLASAAGHLGAKALKDTPIISKLAGKLRLGCSQEALAKETAVECSPIWLPSPAPLRRRLEGTLAMETALGSAKRDISRVDFSTPIIDIDLS